MSYLTEKEREAFRKQLKREMFWRLFLLNGIVVVGTLMLVFVMFYAWR